VLVVVLVLEDSDHFAISLAEQNSCKTSVYLRNRAEDEHDDEDEDDLGSSNRNRPRTRPRPRLLDLRPREGWILRLHCSEPGTKGGQQDVLPFESCIKAVTVDRMPRIRNRLRGVPI